MSSVVAPSLPLTAAQLSDLAVKARDSAEQDRMIAQNVHASLPALLVEGTTPLETQAQAARLLANLAFQPPNKVVLTEAGAVEALQVTLENALAITYRNFTNQPFVLLDEESQLAAKVLVEATAALGNLSSGRSLRERCADASCPVPRILLFLVNLWNSMESEPRSLNAAAAEATRALSSLSASRNAHPALIFSNTPVALLELVDKTAAARGGVIGGATARVCLVCGADTVGDEDDTASFSEDDDTDADVTAAMLSRALLALTNLLGDPRRTAAACDVHPTLPERRCARSPPPRARRRPTAAAAATTSATGLSRTTSSAAAPSHSPRSR